MIIYRVSYPPSYLKDSKYFVNKEKAMEYLKGIDDILFYYGDSGRIYETEVEE